MPQHVYISEHKLIDNLLIKITYMPCAKYIIIKNCRFFDFPLRNSTKKVNFVCQVTAYKVMKLFQNKKTVKSPEIMKYISQNEIINSDFYNKHHITTRYIGQSTN